ncbi:MAG TPA: transposase, partial [Peptococcaceae bacterium]|nr:transposase [Peptococcaceae bacterium]
GFAERMPRELLKRLSPKEGWKPFRLWGKLFGLYKAARKRAIREDRVFQGWGPTEWLSFMFNGTG